MEQDYFTCKIVHQIMRKGNKSAALKLFRAALFILKKIMGFQPYFMFKRVAFGMRQLFKVNTLTIRQTRVLFKPNILRPHNQVSYGVNNIMSCMRDVRDTEKLKTPNAIAIILLNSFIYTSIKL